MKKKKKKNFNSTDNIYDDFYFSLSELLLKEQIIEAKKKLGLELSSEEYFFDNYIIKPSIIYLLLRSSINGRK